MTWQDVPLIAAILGILTGLMLLRDFEAGLVVVIDSIVAIGLISLANYFDAR